MAITHTKVSAVVDGADTDLVRPVDWNADHTGQPTSISDFLDDTAGGTDALVTKAPTSNAMYDGLLAKIPKSLLTEQGDVIYASAASTPAALVHATLGQALKSGGHGANPSWGNIVTFVTTQVFSGTSPTTFTDLDLSAVVGANQAIVIIKWNCTDLDATRILKTRKNGEALTTDWSNLSGTRMLTGAPAGHTLTVTDTSGIIEWLAEAALTYVGTMEAYIK